MEFATNPYVRVTVEFIHDVATGAFPGAVWFAWMVKQRMETSAPEAVGALTRSTSNLWVILIVCLFAIAATGAFRLVYWKLNVVSGGLERKKRLIWMKHTLFVLLYVGSFALATTLVP